eukprot:scaffold559311_cov19-Prasinocladus_malaysianus.AAC.1
MLPHRVRISRVVRLLPDPAAATGAAGAADAHGQSAAQIGGLDTWLRQHPRRHTADQPLGEQAKMLISYLAVCISD